MSFSSRSSSSGHHRHGHYGNNHYKRRGFMDKIFDLVSSKSHSNRKHNYYHEQQPYNDPNIYNQQNNQPNYNQNSITCTKCKSQMPEGSKFCLQCGQPVNEVLFCKNCGEKLPSSALFCHKCGTKVTK